MEDVDRGANRLMQDHWLENIRPLKCGEVVFHSHGCILNVICQYECDSPPALFFRELFSEGAQTPCRLSTSLTSVVCWTLSLVRVRCLLCSSRAEWSGRAVELVARRRSWWLSERRAFVVYGRRSCRRCQTSLVFLPRCVASGRRPLARSGRYCTLAWRFGGELDTGTPVKWTD